VSLVRLRLFYFCALGALGGSIPLLASRLDGLGIEPRSIGLLMAVLPAGRLVSGPLWGWYADTTGRTRDLLVLGSLVALVGTIALARVDSVPLAALALAAFAIGRAPVGPLVDALAVETLASVGRDRAAYGGIRLWGSVGFLATALLTSQLQAHLGMEVPWPGIVLAVLTTLLAWGFPAPREAPGPAPIGPALRALVGRPGMTAWLLFVALQALTLSVYDTFFSMHVHRLGLPASTTGWAVAVGVLVEVISMQAGGWVLRRVGAERMMLVAALSAVPRFLLTARATTPVTLVAVQALHGTSFAWFWLGAVQWITVQASDAVSQARVHAQDDAPTVTIARSAQSLLATASYGLGALIGALGAGEVARAYGTAAVFEGLGFVAVAAACAAGIVVRSATMSSR
jgi:PPP family 3-phenylpropionic acid transporter